jgi:NAD(P)-dependent dehydrogenase (short-subunit alcohol dehydrogenase family)
MKKNILQNRVVLITGANKGIGKELSLLCAKLGAEVILTGRNVKQLETVYDEICEHDYPEPAIFPINLPKATPQHILDLKENIDSLFGKLDILVHNAGMTGPLTPIQHLKPQDWQQIIQLNLNAPYLLTSILLPLIQKSDSGRIIFPIPREANQNKAFWSAYAASKAGLQSFAKTLNQELINSTAKSICLELPKTQTELTLKAYPGIDLDKYCSAKECAALYIPHLYELKDSEKSCVS